MSPYWASQFSNREAFLLPGEHGGQLEDLAEQYGIKPEQITDFSVNVNPPDLPDSLVKLLQKSIPFLSRYPDSKSRHRPDLTVDIPDEKLICRGLYVRNCTSFIGLDERFFRIAVRKRWENQRLLASLREIESD